MRLHRLRLRHFRGTVDRDIDFAEHGVTIVEGPNEVGKSSLVEALDLLLGYQAHSRAQAVQRVQPVGADVATEVAAELECGPYRFTYAKRFNREHGTTLDIARPEREQLAGAEAHERVQSLFAEHVDETLWRALRVYQGVPLDQADLSEQRSLAAALDAATGARVGGEREAALFERIVAEYERYHTPGGQPAKDRRAIAEAQRVAATDAAEAEEALTAVEQDVARCGELGRALADLAPALASTRERADTAAQAWRALEREQLEVERLALSAEGADAEHRRALEALESRQELVRRRAAAERDLADVRSALERQSPAAAAAERDLQAATARADGLRAEVAAARAEVHDREQALQALHDRETLAALDARIARLEEAEAERAAAQRTLAGPEVDDRVLEALEEAAAAVHVARAAVEAEAPEVTIRRLARVEVAVDGVVADDEARHRVTDTVTVRVGTYAEVVVDAGREGRSRRDRVTAAERTIADLLERCGVPDVAAARAVHRRRAEAETALERADRAIGEAGGGDPLPALREERAALARRATGATADAGDLDAAHRAADAARTRLGELENDLAAADASVRDATARRAALREAAAGLEVRAEAAEAALADVSAALGTARAALADDAVGAAGQRAAEASEAAAAALRDARARLDARDPAGVEAAHEEAAAVRRRLEKEQRALEDELRDTRARLGVRGEEGLHDRLAAAERRLDECSREHERVEARAAAAVLLHRTFAARREDATRAYARPLREKLERLGRIVYGDDFAVELGDDLRVDRRSLGGRTLAFRDLSTGAREQLALLTRLAVAALVARDGGVPLIVDDALGSSDPARLERLGAALRVAARDAQVILLTCAPDRYRWVGDAAVVRLR